MYNNFELNETTGVGLIKDDNDNNILIKTDANEEQLTEILEKENEFECEQNKQEQNITNKMNYLIKRKKHYKFMEKLAFLIRGIIGLFTIYCGHNYIIGNLSEQIFLSIITMSASLFCITYSFMILPTYIKSNKINELEKNIEESSYKIKKLKEEFERLKSKVQIEEMNTKEVVSSLINYPIRSEEENTNSYYNAQSGPVKFKSLRKEFEK